MKFDFQSFKAFCFRFKWWLAAALVLIAGAAAVSVSSWWYFHRPVSFAGGAAVVDVVVPEGASGRVIARLAQEAGMELDDGMLFAALRVDGNAPAIHAGRYRFRQGMTLAEIVDRFTSGAVESFNLRIPDGATLRQVRRTVEAAADLVVTTAQMSDDELRQALGVTETSLEGLFAPETYNFRSGTSDMDVYRTLYRTQMTFVNDAWQTRDPEMTELKSPYEVLILASIIEKEASRPQDRLLVSSVFHNRLRRGMMLQTDPTIIYGLGEAFDGNLTRNDLRRPGPYNTYLNKGLPPTPIAMPSKASIAAAVHPARTKYLYFVARGDGTTEFSTHLTAHNRAVYKYQKNPRRRAQPAAQK